jgi:hypothetical protein
LGIRISIHKIRDIYLEPRQGTGILLRTLCQQLA